MPFRVLSQLCLLLPRKQVFAQVQRSDMAEPWLVGPGSVFVTKNPCLSPGDVAVLECVDVPGLRHLVNVVVFPQKGAR